MELHDLGFLKAIKIKDDLAEFIVNDGVEFDLPMVDVYHNWITTHLTAPCLVLVNKMNAYTYTFEAQRIIGTLPAIKAVAFVVYNRVSEITTNNLAAMPRDIAWNKKIFDNREEAIAWLESQR
ncbi:MAG: hypothetical protein D4R48_02985 [Nitrosomonadales bacterium]|nr:MAG: hypothetical protein D4R48_02985 [Nitrosomonadales bacterium]